LIHKVFSGSYIRWFRDIAPPSEDIPVSLALSDANHAVSVANDLLGPVHLNIQFRENLAPDAGPIRGDSRAGSVTSFSTKRFTDIAGFQRWSGSGKKWSQSYSAVGQNIDLAMLEIGTLISRSKRGIIVVGNLRKDGIEGGSSDTQSVAAIISDFAESIGFPVFAGSQSANLRFYSPAVIPYADYILKSIGVKEKLQPDLIIQIGSHLVSTEVQGFIGATMKANPIAAHVLIHTSRPSERVDASGTITHQIFSEIEAFLPNLQSHLTHENGAMPQRSKSALIPLVLLGRQIASKIPDIIHEVSEEAVQEDARVWECTPQTCESTLTEPQIMLAMSEVLSELQKHESLNLFLSNSMPVRDAEFFLYPQDSNYKERNRLASVAVNRGASGIDGIISSATGYTEASSKPTTLLIGDLATIHDLNSFHNLARQSRNPQSPTAALPLTTIIVNNDGGGIFSFLPIAKHGNDVNFEEFFGTPTNSFSFGKGAEAFGLPFNRVTDYESFKAKYKESFHFGKPSILEAQVVDRGKNVQVHAEITKATNELITDICFSNLIPDPLLSHKIRLPLKDYTGSLYKQGDSKRKTLLLLHGWMGDKTEWDLAASAIIEELSDEWNVVAIDLPAHGDSPLLFTTEKQAIQGMLGNKVEHTASMDDVAVSVLKSLQNDYKISTLDAIAGYSLGGRVAMAMMNKSAASEYAPLVSANTKLLLFGSNPGSFHPEDVMFDAEANILRRNADAKLASTISTIFKSQYLYSSVKNGSEGVWIDFLTTWYDLPLWANVSKRNPLAFSDMVQRRASSLAIRAPDIAHLLSICSAGRNYDPVWKSVDPSQVTFIAGALDEKYSFIGKEWRKRFGIKYHEIENSGHALLTEAPLEVAALIAKTLSQNRPHIRFSKQEYFDRRIKHLDEEMPSSSNSTPEQPTQVVPSLIDIEEFQIELVDRSTGKGVNGIGWGDQGQVQNIVNARRGLILSLSSSDGILVGLGEVSPLSGVHPETLDDAKGQMNEIRNAISNPDFKAELMDCERILSFDGSLNIYIDGLVSIMIKTKLVSFTTLLASVRSGLEMALLSLASHATQNPLPQSLQKYRHLEESSNPTMLPMNGLLTRKTTNPINSVTEVSSNTISYSSMKVKVGHQSVEDDALAVINARKNGSKYVRADANRGWTELDAKQFVLMLRKHDVNIDTYIEFIEEPLQKSNNADVPWSLKGHVEALEKWYDVTGIKYALDESLAEAVLSDENNFPEAMSTISDLLKNTRGCAAFILKPSLLGLEKAMHLAIVARVELGIGAVFTSTFDSGVGLAFTAFLASLSDTIGGQESRKFSHGLSTFSMMGADTLTPAFESYVTKDGLLNVASLGRSIHGLGLDEIRDYADASGKVGEFKETSIYSFNDTFQSASSTSDTGRDINIHVSLPLPFSDEIARNRFADLPQQPRWSPWLNSVAYLEEKGQTEWTLNVRGVEFRWKAVSKVLDNPKGIMWESTSGLKNQGCVEFLKVSDEACLMRVRMTIITPRIIALAFNTSGEFVKDFVEKKLLKWSLESFRDVVKADLALERGDAELGDALFGAVEGRSNAIEATLTFPSFDD
jgi:2-succinyl-5-enolpyruvyl-6-hydroxy-3-cyclohexene-1-carboxylate synthase